MPTPLIVPTPKELMQVFVESAPHGCVIADTDGKFLMVNKAFADILDEPVDDIIGSNYADFTPIQYRVQDAMQMEHLMKYRYCDWFNKKYMLRKKEDFVKVRLCLALIERDGALLIWSLVRKWIDSFNTPLERDNDLPPDQLSRDPLSKVKSQQSEGESK